MTLPDFAGQFMPTMIAAAPGTCIIELVGAGEHPIRTPIVAWAPDADNPYKSPHPITVTGLQRLIDRGVEFDEGYVVDPRSSVPFANADEWVAFAESGPATSPVRERHTTTTPSPAAPAPDSLKIEWANAPFKNNSFYQYEGDDLNFVFQIDGGEIPPKQKGNVTKIKRDEFMALKKEIDVADADDLRNGVAPGLDDIGGYDETPEYVDEDNLI